MRGVGLVLCVAACGGDGIFIEVRPAAGVKVEQVELVIGDRLCTLGDVACDGMQPQGFGRTLGRAGDVFFRAGGEFIAPIADGKAVFQLAPDTGTLPVVVAIGSTGGEVTGAAIMENTIDLTRNPVRYVAQLDPVQPLNSAVKDPANAGVSVWPHPATDELVASPIGCLGVQRFGTQRGPLFVVPTDDPDCDGVPQPECNPLAYNGVKLGTTLCATPSTTIPGMPCVVGHESVCSDLNQAQSCVDTNTCLPSRVCQSISGATCAPTDVACHSTVLAAITDPRIRCAFPGNDDGNGVVTPCNPAEPLKLSRPTSITLPMFTCKGPPRFGDLQAPYDMTTDTMVINQATLEVVSNDETTCDIEFDWTGMVTDSASAEVQALLEFDVLTPSDHLRHLRIPFSATFVPGGCGQPAACTFSPQPPPDSEFLCAQ